MPAGAGLILSAFGGGGSAFTPFDEPGMLAWWNSENTSLDGGNNVISCLDLSGNGTTLIAGSAPQRPAVTFGDPQYGSHASCAWSNAANTYLESSAISISQYTMVQVCKPTASATTYLASFSAGDYVYNGVGFSMFSNVRTGGGGTSSWNAQAGNGWDLGASPKTFLRRMNGTHAGDTIRVNGVLVPMNGAGAGDPGTGPFNATFAPMNAIGGGSATDGSWVTTLFYDHAVSDAVAAKLEAYFRTLYAHY